MADVIDIDEVRERRECAARLKAREHFESELQGETRRRLNATIVSAITVRTGAYNQSLHLGVVRNMLEKFTSEQGRLLTYFAELKQLPIGADSRVRRLVAFERVVHQYLPGVLCEELQRSGLAELLSTSVDNPQPIGAEISDAS